MINAFRILIVAVLLYGGCSYTAQAMNAGTTPTGFIENKGQWPAQVLFVAKQNNAAVWITTTGVVVDEYTQSSETQKRTGVVTREHFRFSTHEAVISGTDAEHIYASFLLAGSEHHYTAKVYSSIVIKFADGVEHHYSRNSEARVQRTVVAKDLIHANSYLMTLDGGVSKNQVTEVTPVTSTVYGSYIGGPGADLITGVEYLSNGDVVVCGSTSEITFPDVTGGYSKSMKGTSDGFIVRLDGKLQKAKSYSFIGGSGDDRIRAMCKDAQNAIYVTGETTSNDFPVTSGVTGKLFKAGIDAFVAKLDSSLSTLVIGLYHGGNKDDVARAIAVGPNGLIYLAGYTNSTTNFPVTFPATITVQIPGGWGRPPTSRTEPGGGTNMGQIDGFVASFSSNGAMQQSRFFGRENNEYITAMAVDKSNSVYLTGSTTSANFETAPTSDRFSSGRLPFDNSFNGGNSDAFVVKLNNELALAKSDDGTYSSYFGGNKEEEGRSIVIDDLGRAYVVGVSNSTNLNAVGTLNTQAIGKQDVFLAVVSDDGRELIGCTYYGGTGDDEPFAVKLVEGTSSVVIAGSTNSEDFPFAGEGLVTERSGNTDGFLSVINLSTNQYATLISGNQEDTVKALSIGPFGSPYYVASTTSTNLHVNDSSFARTSAGLLGGYVAKHAYGVLELTAPTGGETYCVGISKPISWSALGMPDTTKFRIEFARAGSNQWQDVVKNVGGRSYSWKVPGLPTGDYVLRISTIYNHLSQLLTPFTISNPPTITNTQTTASACQGKPAVLYVAAQGAGLKYQWRKSGVNIPNATQEYYTIPAVDATTVGKYDCLVSGTCSPSATSQAITVTIDPATEITQQPKANTSVNVGAQFTLSVVATGLDVKYQWFKDANPIAGATSSQYTVASASKADAGDYFCEVRGYCGAVNSAAGSVSVEGGTSVDEEPGSQVFVELVGPQPAADVVLVRISTESSAPMTLRVTDLQGRVISQNTLGTMVPGTHTIAIPLSSCSNGLYIAQFQAGNSISSIKIHVAK